jgi:dienelactone hydrolase
MKVISFLLIAGLVSSLAFAQVQTSVVQYNDNGTALEGYLAFKKGTTGKQPGVLLVHDWMGLNQYYRDLTRRLAEPGYVAFAADIYGKGVRPKDSTSAAEEANKYKSDRLLMRQRIRVALEGLKKNSNVDPARVAAIGYCFGGTVVLELARSGADISGVASFHGGLDTPTPEDAKNVKARILALHGADDPFVPPQQVAAFQDEMRKGGVDWQMIYYGNAVHSFTVPAAGGDRAKGTAYDEKADRRSWEAMESFFKEVFATPDRGGRTSK